MAEANSISNAMTIQRALQLTTSAVALIGAVFLALGHDSTWLPALLAMAAVLSVLLSDLVPWLRLNRMISNLVAVGAVVWSLYDFMDRSPDQQLMSIAQMLVYLQTLLLFQEKTSRTYWQLLVLSLLQVVVSAALSSGPQFGLLLIAYLVAAILSLLLLCIYSDLRLDPPPATPAERPRPTAAWRQLLTQPEVEPPRPFSRANAAATTTWSLGRHVTLIAIAALGFAFVFFYTTPRLHDAAWHGSRLRSGGRSGFATEVSIEESGRIHLGNQIVMRLALNSAADRRPYSLVGEPYLQGAVLTRYQVDSNGSRWIFPPRRSPNVSEPPASQIPLVHLVKQTCVLEVVHNDYAFAVMPLETASGNKQQVKYYRSSGRLKRGDFTGYNYRRELSYEFLTPAFRNGRQLRGIPHWNPVTTFAEMAVLDEDLHELRYVDGVRFARLKQIAEVILRRAGASSATPLQRALALERHFFEPGRYRYSLNLDFQRDPKLDPIEDFISNHHTGHCEYFASALVLMLRSQGIPARMVVGYKGGELNMLGKYYVIREKHAHAWVEAWMPPGEVPASEQAGTPHEGGCWYRLDPTPASSGLAESGEPGLRERITDTFDYAELIWRDYVLNLNTFAQQQAVTDPLSIGAGAIPDWIDPNRLERMMKGASSKLGLKSRDPRRPGLDWPLALVVGVLMAGLIVVTRFGPSVVPLLRRWWKSRAQPTRTQAPEFYLRLERLLTHLPLKRTSGQTPRELAAAAGQRLARGGKSAAAELPPEIVETYYRVRFGGAALDKVETEAIEHALTQLVPAVRQAQKR